MTVETPVADNLPDVDVVITDGEAQVFKAHASGPQNIPLSLIRPAEIALRGVNREDVNYQTLRRSIQAKGVLNSILVREQKDPVSGVITYALIDGLQRYTCACDCGQITIPANVVNMDDGEALEAQIITNVSRVETKPAEYAKALLRILHRNPMMTLSQLAEKLCQSITWLTERLSLTNLNPEIAKLVDSDQISLTNAYALAKLPDEEQIKEVDAAMSESPSTFVVRMKNRLKEIREAKKAGKDVSETGFVPVAHMRKLADVKAELEAGVYRTAVLGKNEITGSDAQKAWELAIKWILNMDDDSVAEQKREYDARVARKEEAAKKREAEKAEKKAKAAAEAAVDLTKLH